MTTTMNRHARRRLAREAGIPWESMRHDRLTALQGKLRDLYEEEGEEARAIMAEEARSDPGLIAVGMWELELEALVQDGTPLTKAVRLAEAKQGVYPKGLYRNYHHLFLARGRLWKPSDVTLHKDLPGEPPDLLWDGFCYENAYRAAHHYGLDYAEGWALLEVVPEGHEQPLRLVSYHAWCYDPSTGGIVDTWPGKGSEYFGIAYDWEQVERSKSVTGRRAAMVPNDHKMEFDLLTNGVMGMDYEMKGG